MYWENRENIHFLIFWLLSTMAQGAKNLPAIQEMRVWSLGLEDPLEDEMATHPSILAWRISQTEEPGGLQSTGLQRVRHDWVTKQIGILFRPSSQGLIEKPQGKVSLMFVLQWYFGYDCKSTSKKSKNKQLGLHQTKKLSHTKKANQQNEKSSCGLRENICKSYIW